METTPVNPSLSSGDLPPPPAQFAAGLLENLMFYFTNSQGEPNPATIQGILQMILPELRILQNDPSFKGNANAQAMLKNVIAAFPDSGSPAEVAKFFNSMTSGVTEPLLSEIALFAQDVQQGIIN